MEEKTIENVPAMQFAMMMGAIQAVIGLIAGIFMAIFATAILSMIQTTTTQYVPLAGLGILFGLGAIIVMPIASFIIGFIQGLIMAVAYNFLAPRIGGIKLHFSGGSQEPS